MKVNYKMTYKLNAFELSCKKGYKDMVIHMITTRHIDLKSLQNGVYLASEGGHADVVEILSGDMDDKIFDINFTSFEWGSPLYIACQNGHWHVVRILLGWPNINVNMRCSSTPVPTALDIASLTGHRDIVQLLVDAPGIDLEAVDDYGLTAYNHADSQGHEEIVLTILHAITYKY